MKKVLIPLVIILLIAGCCEETTLSVPDYRFLFEMASTQYSDNCFYLAQPELLYETYSEDEVAELDLPEGWANNAIKTTYEGQWLIDNTHFPNLPDLSTLRVFIDDGIESNNSSSIEGCEIDIPDTVYYFNELLAGIDFYSGEDILYFTNDILKKQTIGITYIQHNGLQVGNPDSSSIEVKLLKKPYQNFIDDPEYWELQVRNIYDYGNVSLDGGASVIIGYKNNHTGSLISSIPDSIDTGSHYNTVKDYLRLDTNQDAKVNPEDTIFDTANHLIRLPYIYPFKSLEDMNIYQNDYLGLEDWKYYIKIEEKYYSD